MITPVDWTDAITLEEYVVSLYKEGKTQTREYALLVRVYGQAKLSGFIAKYCEKEGRGENYGEVSHEISKSNLLLKSYT